MRMICGEDDKDADSCVQMRKRIEQLEGLLREVLSWHSDERSPEYQECESAACNWCERAKKALLEAR